MFDIIQWAMFCMLVGGLLTSSAAIVKPKVPRGPVPAQIANASKIFIANAPGDSFPDSDGGPERPYDEFYVALKTWGQYELVASPAEADAVFEISYTNSLIGLGGTSTAVCSSTTNPRLLLVIVDPKTQTPLWWFAEGIEGKESVFRPTPKLGDAFPAALSKLVDDVKKLSGGAKS